MKKLISVFIISSLILLLVGCEEYGRFDNMIVKEKNIEEVGRWSYNKVTLEKNGHEVVLDISESQYDVLKVGAVINVTYDRYYDVQEIEFPLLQDKKESDK